MNTSSNDLPDLLPVLVALSGVLGLVIGSFLNVVVWRVPRGESVVRPPSACPHCGHPIRARDNVPVLSWLALRGRCRDCAGPISVRYPIVEASTGLLFAAVTAGLGLTWALPAYLFMTAVAVALALIDLQTRRLPDVIVLPAYPVLLALLTLASANPGGPSDWSALLRAALAGAVLFVVYFVLWFVYPGGMGYGDVKLAGLLGLALGWIGWGPVVVGGFAAFLLGGLYGLGLIAARRGGGKTAVAFGPWMLLGAALGVAVGVPLFDLYLGLLA